MVKIKICGLTRQYDIDTVNACMPDYIGFVFADSKRKVSPKQATELRQRLARGISPVGVFVDETIECVLSLIRGGVIDVVQLHGMENEDYIKRLKKLTDKPIIKAIAVQNALDVRKWENSCADYLLLDSKGGGTGQTFDWALIGETTKPYFLAGGLNITNVESAIDTTKPFAVDVSSGVEENGLKDRAKIDEFIRRVRNGTETR
jgi:phosphoribosylanthranilate isomerase